MFSIMMHLLEVGVNVLHYNAVVGGWRDDVLHYEAVVGGGC